jgi:antitoxin ParD1/3/4
MGKLERITVTMPEEMAERLRAAVERGDYATTSEAVREALRDWGDHVDRREAENARMRIILERAKAGPRFSSDEVFGRTLETISAIERRKALEHDT